MSSPSLYQPSYHPSDCQLGIIHVGVGAFHRAHQANYVDHLLELGISDWGIAGVNLRAQEDAIIQQIKARDYRYILKTISPENQQEYREIKAIQKLLNWSNQRQEAIDLFALDSVQLVTVTVTESGYSFDENFELNENAPEIAAELANPDQGLTIYHYLRQGLHQRLLTNNQPITVLCCDNLRYNGLFLEKSLKKYLSLFGDDLLLDWLDDNVSFPCCMVDRITPSLNNNPSAEIEQLFSISDDSTIMAEQFSQWVIEDKFSGTRPPLEKVGVEFTNKVTDYEEIKIRILNGGHTSLCYFGALAGYEFFHDIFGDPYLKSFFHDQQDKEIIPALGDNMVMDLTQYKITTAGRFSNSHISDSLARICMDGAHKFSIFILPTLKNCFKKDITPHHTISVIASWYVFMRFYDEGLIDIKYAEPKWDLLQTYLSDDKLHDFTEAVELWGVLPREYPQFSNLLYAEIKRMEGLYRDRSSIKRHQKRVSNS